MGVKYTWTWDCATWAVWIYLAQCTTVFHLTSQWCSETYVRQRGEPKHTRHDSCRWVSLATVTCLELMPDFHQSFLIWIQPTVGVVSWGEATQTLMRKHFPTGICCMTVAGIISQGALTHRHEMILFKLQKELNAPLLSSDGWLTPRLIKRLGKKTDLRYVNCTVVFN